MLNVKVSLLFIKDKVITLSKKMAWSEFLSKNLLPFGDLPTVWSVVQLRGVYQLVGESHGLAKAAHLLNEAYRIRWATTMLHFCIPTPFLYREIQYLLLWPPHS